jgi:2-polyprenyl-6-methoxyphenol hydroxylase-like FAD-dependent oxidoreductase
MKIDVIGGGPSGLYFALLIRRHRPDWRVRVIEQNARDATFGFGVVLADTGLHRLQEADAESHDRLVAAMRFADRQVIVHREQPLTVRAPSKAGGAITRLALLDILGEIAQSRGVEIAHGQRLEANDVDALARGADLLVGADGANSVVRASDEAGFGSTRAPLSNRFAWYGTTQVFDSPALVFRCHKVGSREGSFVAHYYPYSDTMSTFVAECDARTWEALQLAGMSDDERLRLTEQVFAPELEGHPLISNNSAWKPFQVVRNRTTCSGNKVLLGDAHASAHPTIGSGSRIAIEDAISLAQALIQCEGRVADALPLHDGRRAPEKHKLIAASEKSYLWYEDFDRHMAAHEPHEFVYSYMTRTGRIDDARLAAQFPELMKAILERRAAAAAA